MNEKLVEQAASEEWVPLSQDEAECELLDCLKNMFSPRDDKCLIAEMRKRGLWVYRRAMLDQIERTPDEG